MSLRPLDTGAVLDFPLEGLRLIEASAGTGKTYTIANLYLRHVLAGRAVSEVLVVTFTVAATDELRGRIRARLFQALALLEHGGEAGDPFLEALILRIRQQEDGQTARRRLSLAVRSMDEAAIYTIHGFCQRALTEFAFHSGQRFRLEVLTDDAPLWREAVADWWRRTGYPLDPLRSRVFLEALGGLEGLRRDLAPLLGHQHRRLLPPAADLQAVLARCDDLGPGLAALAANWRREGERLGAVLRDSPALKRAQGTPFHPARLEPALAVLDSWARAEPLVPPPADAFQVVRADVQEAQRKVRPDDPGLADPFFARCAELAADVEALHRDLRVAALADAAVFARARVAAAKDEMQGVSFDDLLTTLRDALEGPGGSTLAQALAARFPVALIDEFQDTDPVQYAIFRSLYVGREGAGLILIGDPKQAIYSFRGGDIFTYMAAKGDVGDGGAWTLGTNWRSTPAVIDAVNRLFQHRPRDAFVYGEAIPFAPVAAADKEHHPLLRGGTAQTALTLWTLPEDVNARGEPKPLSKEIARGLSHGAVADEVARLVAEGRAGDARLGGRALAPRDIAVLVRTAHEAAELRRELAARGVDAVSVERTGVFETEEAGALEALLRAVLEPRDRRLARLALASPLLERDYPRIAATARAEEAWVAWVDQLVGLRETWARRGFMAMFQQMLRSLGVADALARGEHGERRLTNLLHLGELLQQASKARGGMDALVHWLRLQRQETGGDEALLRLESDAELVQIVTIHASKGLEYPVVFVPYLWGCRTRERDDPLAFHRDGEACLDAGSGDYAAHLRLAEQERLAEDVRLVYVALTRAESALYLVWGRAGSREGRAGQTALAWLLHPHQSREHLEGGLPDALADLRELGPDLENLAAAAAGDIRVAPIPRDDGQAAFPPEAVDAPELAPRVFRGRVSGDWRVASFSALTRDVHAAASAPLRDETAADVGLRFPAGSHVGSYLHLLLERLDFQGDVAAQVMALSPALAARFGLDHGRWGADAGALLERVVATPLDGAGLRLAALGPERRLAELEFDFATGRVDPAALDRLLAQAAGGPLPPLGVERFQGLVNGVIDLVFEHQGRYYLADYKSNFLGGRLADYEPPGLRAAVFERRYDLQYLLYTLALHRYLRGRLVDYDYARHFGGVYYLFLRGLRPETGPACGVWFHRPEGALVAALDRQVFPHGGAT